MSTTQKQSPIVKWGLTGIFLLMVAQSHYLVGYLSGYIDDMPISGKTKQEVSTDNNNSNSSSADMEQLIKTLDPLKTSVKKTIEEPAVKGASQQDWVNALGDTVTKNTGKGTDDGIPDLLRPVVGAASAALSPIKPLPLRVDILAVSNGYVNIDKTVVAQGETFISKQGRRVLLKKIASNYVELYDISNKTTYKFKF